MNSQWRMWVAGILSTLAIGLAGYAWSQQSFKIDAHDTRMDNMQSRIDQHSERLATAEAYRNEVLRRLQRIEEKVDVLAGHPK